MLLGMVLQFGETILDAALDHQPDLRAGIFGKRLLLSTVPVSAYFCTVPQIAFDNHIAES